jgi:putative RecB family exonuclease
MSPPHPVHTPYLSHSRVNRYLLCPEQYHLYYVENLRPRHPAASLVFGQILHQALAQFFRTKEDPVVFFAKTWEDAKLLELAYGARESWEKLLATGQALLEKFVREEAPRISSIRAIEQPFELMITSLDLPFVGVIDLVAEVDGESTVVDFKTASTAYEEHEVALADQLTAYSLAEPEVERVALWVLVKTKEPRIAWYLSRRDPAQLEEYLAKADLVAREITAGHFFKRPGKWCSWCDFLPVCLGDAQRVEETLMRAS